MTGEKVKQYEVHQEIKEDIEKAKDEKIIQN